MPSSRQQTEDLFFVANRLGYGIRAEDYPLLLKSNVGLWLEEQLSSPFTDDESVKSRLESCRLRIKYDAAEGKWEAVDEMRPLSSLTKPIEELWTLFTPDKQVNGQERGRPRLEVIAATMIRSVYSKFQLREIMTQFWHDHFNVNAFSDDHIAVAFPAYDRDVIRKNSFGNFREFLEAVATSTAMQYYLSNHSSRAGAANENYARELFELHSLGRENYLNDKYDRWRDVPGAVSGQPVGYIDQDVYEAARAFTGWTVEDGTQLDQARKLPATGRFTYIENWHDGYQKRVLASEFDPFAKPMADGRKVLDLIAEHPGTAEHMSTKLCVRLIGSNPPPSVLEKTKETWRQAVNAPDQIAQVIKAIVSSDAFLKSRGQKVKRPVALMASYVRAMGYDFTPSEGLFNQMSGAGQKLFGWPTPTGLPDEDALFLGPNAMRNRWSLLLGLSQNAWGNGDARPMQALMSWGGKPGTGGQIVQEWLRLWGCSRVDENLVNTVTTAAGLIPLGFPSEGDAKHVSMASAIAAMAPEFQIC